MKWIKWLIITSVIYGPWTESQSLDTSILQCGCGTQTLLVLQAFETKCFRKLLCISYLEHKTNNWVQSKISFLVGPQGPLLATVKRWKLAWFRLVTAASPKPSFRAPWKVGDDVVSRGNTGHHQRVDIPARARAAHRGLLQERLEDDIGLIIPHVPPPPTTQSVNGLNWTEI